MSIPDHRNITTNSAAIDDFTNNNDFHTIKQFDEDESIENLMPEIILFSNTESPSPDQKTLPGKSFPTIGADEEDEGNISMTKDVVSSPVLTNEQDNIQKTVINSSVELENEFDVFDLLKKDDDKIYTLDEVDKILSKDYKMAKKKEREELERVYREIDLYDEE